MEKFLAPNGEYILVPDSRVTTFGLTKQQNELVENSLPSKGCVLYDTDVPTDLVAISASSLIINASALDSNGRELIFDCYTELGESIDETVFWLGYPKPPQPLRARFKCYESFEEIASNMKYLLLSAYKKSRNARDFSKKMANCLIILSSIRSNPGIKTQELSEKLEVSTRTIQRYISTLQVAGEWIEYDPVKKGWTLSHGISILFGDHLKDE